MKIGIVFPGYGSQFVGMGKDFYDESRIVQEYFEEAHNCLDINFVKLSDVLCPTDWHGITSKNYDLILNTCKNNKNVLAFHYGISTNNL